MWRLYRDNWREDTTDVLVDCYSPGDKCLVVQVKAKRCLEVELPITIRTVKGKIVHLTTASGLSDEILQHCIKYVITSPQQKQVLLNRLRRKLSEKDFVELRKRINYALYKSKEKHYPNIPADHFKRIMAYIQEAVSDPCMDNYRIARAGHSTDKKRYNRIRAKGCCGFFDSKVSVDGVIYFVGCNYGH